MPGGTCTSCGLRLPASTQRAGRGLIQTAGCRVGGFNVPIDGAEVDIIEATRAELVGRDPQAAAVAVNCGGDVGHGLGVHYGEI